MALAGCPAANGTDIEYPIDGTAPVRAFPLTEDVWATGSLDSYGEQWFTFTATAATQYLHVSFGTLTRLSVQVYRGRDDWVRYEEDLSSSKRSVSYTLTPGTKYYVKVTPSGSSYSDEGTYQITFNQSAIMTGEAVPLTEDVWASGSLAQGGEQWFTFTATVNPQYLHVSVGTLTRLYAQLYDSNGDTVGSRAELHGGNQYVPRPVTPGETYYIKVTPYISYSGTYLITFTQYSVAPPVPLPTEGVIPMTENVWANGNFAQNREQWFTFTATAATQYLHVSFGTLTSLYMQLYDSSGNPVADWTDLSSSYKYTFCTVTSGETYYVMVTPYNSSSSGTYQMGFNTSTTVPPITLPTEGVITMTGNVWANGNLAQNGEEWFTFTATAATQYLHVSFGTLTGLYMQLYDSSGNTVGTRTDLSSGNKYTFRTVTPSQTYYIKVTPLSSSSSGTYQMGFNTSNVTPPITLPTEGVITMTENVWANGNLAPNGEQWFKFTATATASPQYLHVSFGALTDLYVQLYDNSGNTVGTQANLYSSSKYVSHTVTSGQTYYIKVTPYSSSSSGTYRIGFNTSNTPPQ